jgi:hypothetical protein
MQHRTHRVNDDATSATPVRADAETARPPLDAPACRWCRQVVPLRRPVPQLRPLLEGAAPLHGCDHCLTLVEQGLIARGVELLTTPTCQPWCASHRTDPDGSTCLAPPAVAPTEPDQDTGRVVMWWDTKLGHIINLQCKVDDLTLDDAELLLRALRTQITRARRASR